MLSLRSVSLSFILTAHALAQPQVTVTVGPQQAPLFGPIVIALSNETPSFQCQPCWDFSVRHVGGTVIRELPKGVACPAVCRPFPSGAVLVIQWDPTESRVPVPPGNYIVSVDTNIIDPSNPLSHHPVTIGAPVAGALAQHGPLVNGRTRGLSLIAPRHGGEFYILAAALGIGPPGIPTCAGTFPLNPDPLLAASLVPGSPFFRGFQGVLDPRGQSAAAVTLPQGPALVGLNLAFAFVTLPTSSAGPCPIAAVSAPLVAQIQ